MNRRNPASLASMRTVYVQAKRIEDLSNGFIKHLDTTYLLLDILFVFFEYVYLRDILLLSFAPFYSPEKRFVRTQAANPVKRSVFR
jgi:hypothetical protein